MINLILTFPFTVLSTGSLRATYMLDKHSATELNLTVLNLTIPVFISCTP